MLRIYGDSISGNCHKVKWVTDYLGLPYVWIETSVLAGETRTDDFLALNPAGQAPLIILPDGRPLAQSNAIIVHLAHGSALIPEDAYDRAKMLEWLFWEQYSHEPYIAVRRFNLRYLSKPESALDPQLKVRGDQALARMQAWLEASPYLVGKTLTCADIALLAYTRMAHEGGFDLAQFPAVAEWIGRVDQDLGLAA